MLKNFKIMPSFHTAIYTPRSSYVDYKSISVDYSLFQFGFSWKKRKENEREEGREGEEDREVKEQKVEEISTEKRGMMLEDKRVRKYLNTWETDFPWPSFEANNNKMYCKVFPQFPSLADITSSLYSGTGSFRKTTIQAHARSKSHHFYSKEL